MQISHSLRELRSHSYASPPRLDQTPKSPKPEQVDRFESARSSEDDNPNYLGMALLGLAAVTGFVAGRATVPQAEVMETEIPCECPVVDLELKEAAPKNNEYQNPDDWKEELGGGQTTVSPGRKKGKGTRKTTKPVPRETQRESRDYDYPDAWKEEIGGYRSYESDRGSETEQSDQGWENPDDWKSGL